MARVVVMDPDLMTAEMAAEVLDRHETWTTHDIDRAAELVRSHPVDAIVLAHSSEAPFHIRKLRAVADSVPVILINSPRGIRNGGEIRAGDIRAVVRDHGTPEELRHAVEQVCGRG